MTPHAPAVYIWLVSDPQGRALLEDAAQRADGAGGSKPSAETIQLAREVVAGLDVGVRGRARQAKRLLEHADEMAAAMAAILVSGHVDVVGAGD